MESIYKIEPKKPSGRYVLAVYHNQVLREIKFYGEGWTDITTEESKISYTKI